MSLLRQGRAYLLVGALQWLIDCGLTIGLSQAGLLPIEATNLCGRVTGAALGFWLNGRITFAGPGHALGPVQLRRFLLMWVITTALSTVLIAAAEEAFGLHGAWMAKPLIEIALAALGFVLSRHWVYRP